MIDSFGRCGYKKNMLKLQSKYGNTSFLCTHLVLYLTSSVSNNLEYLQFFGEKESVFEKVSTGKMVATLEYSKIQNLICNNSITHRIMTDTYNTTYVNITTNIIYVKITDTRFT